MQATPPAPGTTIAPLSANPAPAGRSTFIASPAYDLLFFIFSPLLALALAFALGFWRWPFENTTFLGGIGPRVLIFGAIWTNAHLFAVVFRSHANREIFEAHKARFTIVPLILFAALFASDWVLVTGVLVAAIWDVYHTSMQTFGFCRIYDSKRGNPPERGRTLDMWINHTVYIGPILGGLSLVPTLDVANDYEALGWDGMRGYLDVLATLQPQIATIVIASGTAFIGFYVISYVQLARAGHQVAWQKVAILGSTAITSIYAWGFLPPIEAFFIANFFHALQYFAIVWSREKTRIQQLLWSSGDADSPEASRDRSRLYAGLAVYLSMLALVGLWMSSDLPYVGRLAAASTLTIALMHFWYDGFIWSVRQHQV